MAYSLGRFTGTLKLWLDATEEEQKNEGWLPLAASIVLRKRKSLPMHRLQIRWVHYTRLVGNACNIICAIETGKEMNLFFAIDEGVLIQETTNPDLLFNLLIIVFFCVISNSLLCRQCLSILWNVD